MKAFLYLRGPGVGGRGGVSGCCEGIEGSVSAEG